MFLPISRFIVEGNSMLPSYKSGEHLLINKIIYKIRSPKRGEVIVARHPKEKNILLLKRINDFVGPTSFVVISDNQDEGTDSRFFGAIKQKDIVGKVFFKY